MLGQKLGHLVKGSNKATEEKESNLATAYILIFEGFTADDIINIEKYIVALKSYKQYGPVGILSAQAECWREAKSTAARLNNNLRAMLNCLNAKVRVTFSGRTFTVEKSFDVIPNRL